MLGAIAAVLSAATGGNPLVPGVGMADPNLHYFNGTFYVFATHDFSVNNTGFLMKDWWAWSSADLVTWQIESIVTPQSTLPWSTPAEQRECWATDAAFTNDKFYFYLSVGGAEVGVVVADSPKGPWHDPLGHSLLNGTLGGSLSPTTTFRDPCVFLDDDGSYYIIAGVFNYYVTRLGPDMVSLAEKPRYVTVNNPYGPIGLNVTDDKPFIHKNGDWYYLSWGCFYAMGKSVYGPYDMMGSVISTATIAPAFRMNTSTTAEDARRERAPPVAGDALILYECNNATAVEWVAHPSFYAENFSLALRNEPSLCIIGDGGNGSPLKLGPCDAGSALQHFSVVNTTSGLDIRGSNSCPCWNVRDNDARSRRGNGPGNGAAVQCFQCVDGGPGGFNPNQRFQLDTATGQIQAWTGYAQGACVAVDYTGNPLPPRPPAPAPTPDPWYRRQDYTDRHGSFLQNKGQWYYASNDRSHSGDPRPGFFRDTVVCYVHFRANGTMEPCTINALGVGEYDALAIEAEDFSELSGDAHKMDLLAHGGGDGFAVSFNHLAALRFTAVHHAPGGGVARVTLRVARGVPGNGTVVVAIGEPLVPLGRCVIPSTGGWARFADVSCVLSTVPLGRGAVPITLTAADAPSTGEILRLDRFAFASASA